MEDASPEEMKAVMDRWAAYGQEAVEKGAFIAGEGLQESSTASTVKIKEALEYAKKIPFQNGSVEVRPVMDYSEFGYENPAEAGATQTASS